MLAIFALIAAAVAYVCTLRSLQPVPSSGLSTRASQSSADATRARPSRGVPAGPQHLPFYRYPSTRKDITP